MGPEVRIMLVAALSWVATGAHAGGLALSEILVEPDSRLETDTGGDEYVELVNTGSETLDLVQFALAGPTGHAWPLEAYTGAFRHGSPGTLLAPGNVALVTTQGYSGRWEKYITKNVLPGRVRHMTVAGTKLLGHGLPNDGGTILLVRTDGAQMDSLTWTKNPGTDVSLERTVPGDPASALRCRFFGGSPGLALTRAEVRHRARLGIERRVVVRGQAARIVLRLEADERADLVVLARDGRVLLDIVKNFRQTGTSMIPVGQATDDGRALVAGTYLVVATITLADGGTAHETVCLQIAPRLR